MATASTSTPNLSSTSLPGITGGGGTTTTNLATVGLPTATGVGVNSPFVNLPTQLAELTLSGTTVTAYAVPSTTGLAVLGGNDGQTLTFRGEGVTLSDGNVVSLGFGGLVESTTTADYHAVSGLPPSGSVALPTGPGPVLVNSTGSTGATGSGSSTLATSSSASGSGSEMSSSSTGSGGSGGGSSGTQASASPAQSPDAGVSLSAGKAAMLLGVVGGIVAMGL